MLDTPGFVVASPAMTDLLETAERAAASPARVLISGESGVGKDLVARFIHTHSPRKAAPFIAVNCAGLTETLLESELFGHITRHDLRELVRRGLRESRGRYKALLKLFGMPEGDYRRFMNFLAAHGCGIAVSEFRNSAASEEPSSGTRPVHSDTIDSLGEDLVVVS